ncbi:MAG TPA: beta-ketoacyl-ACP synthase II [Dehalococcoidia bacterium]|nr:beta-ketoacyl-ACP synthase II [Dehalococcoidia bacterium]
MAASGQSERRVVITGIGMVTAVGIGRETTWEALLNGENGIGPVTLCDTTDLASRVAGEVTDFDPLDFIDRKQARRMDRFTQLALAASGEAIEQAGIDIEARADEVGCMIGCGIGGIQTLEEQFKVLFEHGPSRISPFLVPSFISDMAAGQVSIRYGARGPSYNTVSACASGADAIGTSFEVIRRGDAVAMITGGAEAGVSRMGLASFHASRALSTSFNDDPDRAARPFDIDRDGFVLAEGAATLIIEDLECAQERGAEVIAEVISYGQSADAFHVTQPSENGEGAARAMEIALGHAGIAASEIDYVNAHGTSTQLNDKFETMSVKTVFGESALSLPISATKSMVGHTLGACGAIEGAVTALSLRDQRIHMTRNLDNPDPDCDLDYVPEGVRNVDLTYAMSNSLGFGGHNSSLIFRRFDG